MLTSITLRAIYVASVNMNAHKRETYHHGDLRRALVDAALSLIEEHGGESCTLREVARRAGVSHAAPYRHFRDRDALLAAAAAEGFVKLNKRIVSRSRRARGAQAKLRAWGMAYVAFALRWPALFQLMFGRTLDKEASPEAVEAADQLRDALVEQLEDCNRGGELGGFDPHRAAQVGWAAVHGVAQLALARQLEIEGKRRLEALASDAVGLVLAGLRCGVTDSRTTS